MKRLEFTVVIKVENSYMWMDVKMKCMKPLSAKEVGEEEKNMLITCHEFKKFRSGSVIYKRGKYRILIRNIDFIYNENGISHKCHCLCLVFEVERGITMKWEIFTALLSK